VTTWLYLAAPPAQAHELERQLDRSRDLLANASALHDRHSDAYVLGVALQQIRSLIEAADGVP
jgi:hypothetical protein